MEEVGAASPAIDILGVLPPKSIREGQGVYLEGFQRGRTVGPLWVSGSAVSQMAEREGR